jgi:vancomycin resistance protein VanW
MWRNVQGLTRFRPHELRTLAAVTTRSENRMPNSTASSTTLPAPAGPSADQTPASASLTPAELAALLPRLGARRWSQRIPALYPVAVRYHRGRRRLQWMRSDTAFARTRQPSGLPVRVKRHKSPLLRQLGETEMWMQHNKVTNLKLACAQVDSLLIRPGETFSFNKLVGKRPAARAM